MENRKPGTGNSVSAWDAGPGACPWVWPRPRQTGLLLLLLAPVPRSPLVAQQWNDSTTLALVHRAILARRAAEPDSTFRSYHTSAHGFVLFLAQAGRDLEAPPRLIKADELQVEVYWRAPSTSKQVIRAWRDGRWLPTDISYHRDKPKLLLIDEPIVGLDPTGAEIAKKMFVEYAKSGGAVLFVTHTLPVAQEIAHRIGILKDGSLVAVGTLSELREKAGLGRDASLEEIYKKLA